MQIPQNNNNKTQKHTREGVSTPPPQRTTTENYFTALVESPYNNTNIYRYSIKNN